jgi:hypothetical protein
MQVYHAPGPQDSGQRRSILAKIVSAVVIASAIALSSAGDGLPSNNAISRAVIKFVC